MSKQAHRDDRKTKLCAGKVLAFAVAALAWCCVSLWTGTSCVFSSEQCDMARLRDIQCMCIFDQNALAADQNACVSRSEEHVTKVTLSWQDYARLAFMLL